MEKINDKLAKKLQRKINEMKKSGCNTRYIFLVLNEDIYKKYRFEFGGISVTYKKGINIPYYFCNLKKMVKK